MFGGMAERSPMAVALINTDLLSCYNYPDGYEGCWKSEQIPSIQHATISVRKGAANPHIRRKTSK
jgi:hypothetical protein